MTNKMAKLFGPPGAAAQATTINYEGAPAFVRGDEEALLRVLTVGTFEPTFYATDRDLADEAITCFQGWAERDPRYLAQAILYARTRGNMRLAPITALVALSAGKSPAAKRCFRLIFPAVILTPGDLQDFLTIVRGKRLRGSGAGVRAAAGRWLAGLTEYHAIKYGSESQDMSLRDMYRIARPGVTPGKADAVARYILDGEVDQELLPQVAWYEQFKKAAALKDEEAMLHCIREGRLPWEVVTAHGSTPAVWKAILPNLPYMALLRNINNLVKHGVLDEQVSLDFLVQKLTDPHNILPSEHGHPRLFPFRFYAALQALKVDGAEPGGRSAGTRALSGQGGRARLQRILAEAINQAMETSFVNMPDLGRSVLICNDVSTSMDSKPSPKSDLTMMQIASVFAAAAYKRAEAGEIVSFNGGAIPRRSVSRGMPLALIAEQITGEGGGTDLGAPIKHALAGAHPARYDTAIFITDNEDWYGYLHDHGRFGGKLTLDAIREYRRRVNPELRCFFLQLVPYKHAVAPQEEPGIYYLYGWDSSVLSFIGSICAGGASQVQAVRALPLPGEGGENPSAQGLDTEG